MSAPDIPGLRYVEHLGSGGFADVFCYEQEWPRQRVAVKVVRPDVPLTEREKALFTAEADAMARLGDHPYIVSVLTAGITAEGARPYLVMRFCPPPDLGVRVRSHPLSPADAIASGIKLASAIETAHRAGILHRDIKPSNVLVTSYHEPALTDFGIAGHIHDVDRDHDVRISYPWSAPEMLEGRSNGSPASDVYSLGATIWHLLVGRSPYSVPNGDNSTRALSARILHAAPPATQRPDVPPALDRLLQQCLAKRPEHRPSSAWDLALALQRIEADAGFPRTAVAVGGRPSGLEAAPAPAAGAAPGVAPATDDTVMKPVTVISAHEPEPAAPPPPPPKPRSARTAAVCAVLATAALGAVIGGLALRGDPEERDPLQPDPQASTPLDLLPGPLTQPPTLDASRDGDRVTFRWSVSGGTEPGDRWLVHRLGSGGEGSDGAEEEFERTRRTSLTLTSPDQVCLEVALERDAQDSPLARECV